jgi:hypothetical protein
MIQRIRECCDTLLEARYNKQPIQEYMNKRPLVMPISRPSISASRFRARFDLPSKEVALKYISIAFDQALPLFEFIHIPSFYARLDRFYDTGYFQAEESTLDDVRFEALLFEIFALGELFSAGIPSNNTVDVNAVVKA